MRWHNGLVTTSLVAAALGVAVTCTSAQRAKAHEHDSSAIGQPGDPHKPARIVKVTIEEHSDGTMGFSPNALVVRRGEQVRFEIKNTGRTTHEFILDTFAHNIKHRAEMEKNPEMEHDEPNMQTLEPGKSVVILWRFSRPGTFEYACLIPGHYQAGMHGTVTVK